MNNNLVEALLKAQRNIQHAIKDARAQFGEYSTVNSVIDAVKKVLSSYKDCTLIQAVIMALLLRQSSWDMDLK